MKAADGMPVDARRAPPRRAALDARLYKTYHWSSGAHFAITRRVRPAGVALGLILVLATCLSVGHERGSIYQTFSLCVAMFGIGLPWAFSRRARLEAVREVPRHATVGETLRYPVRVSHTGRWRLSRAWLSESPPDPRPPPGEFTYLREPGEEERNRFDRFFAYFRWQWLVLRRRLFHGGSGSGELRIAPGETARAFLEITPLRRGVVRLDDLRVLLPDPFGLFQRCVRVPAPPALVTVLPRRHALPPLAIPGSAGFRITGETVTNAIGNSGEFTGLRDYRPGDPLRLIHWKSWARTGTPIVKELEDTYYPRYGLVLDTLCADRTDSLFEEAVSVAASFAAAIDTNESLLDLMFVKNEAHVFTAGRGVERVEKLLEVLAAVTPERTGDLHDLAQLVQRHADDLSSCIVVLCGWDEVKARFLTALDRAGILCAPIIVGAGERPPGAPGCWVESGHLARDLKRLPNPLPTMRG